MGDFQEGTAKDADLVKQAASGDARAFGVLYDRYSLNLYRFLCAHCADPFEAEDLTSEVFLRAWRSLNRYKERGYPFSAYLFRIARNAVIDQHRKNKFKPGSLEQAGSLEDHAARPVEEVIKNQEVQKIRNGLKRIRGDYRMVLVLRFINGLPTSEVARIMDRSEGAIRVLQHRALKQLREQLKSLDRMSNQYL